MSSYEIYSLNVRVSGRALVPGAAFFKMAVAALTSAPAGGLTVVAIAAFCILESLGAHPRLSIERITDLIQRATMPIAG